MRYNRRENAVSATRKASREHGRRATHGLIYGQSGRGQPLAQVSQPGGGKNSQFEKPHSPCIKIKLPRYLNMYMTCSCSMFLEIDVPK
jgi:hypothetical protein